MAPALQTKWPPIGGLNPAGVLLFRMRADTGPLHALCGL